MVLLDIRLHDSPVRKNIHITDGVIRSITDTNEPLSHTIPGPHIHLEGYLALPGFINSHEHLDFNCYPAMGNGLYKNYTVWGRDIHQSFATEIDAVKKIPEPLRIKWGLYKNILGGFTTVVNHGVQLNAGNELADVWQECYCLHSPAFEKNWIAKLNWPFRRRQPFVMHIGEGTDEAARQEIKKVIRKNHWKRPIVAVHGVAMNAEQATSFAGLVWCPASNYFLLGTTADIPSLHQHTTIVFGTDSTLTAAWEAAAHFNSALRNAKTTESELLQMLTGNAARLWQLHDRGVIEAGMRADLVIKKEGTSLFGKYGEELSMVIRKGEIMLSHTVPVEKEKYEPIQMYGNLYYVKKGIHELFSHIRSRYPNLYQPFIIS
ncbi:MAG: amidohydrolase family protein [Bacteroidetes bacterium]|nr:amidohydrolase family protein [Bacteroidota bacterium]